MLAALRGSLHPVCLRAGRSLHAVSVRSAAPAASHPPHPSRDVSMAASVVDPRASLVLEYWFGKDCVGAPPAYQCPPELFKKWFGGGPQVDEEIGARFGADLEAVAAGQLDPWIEHPFNAMAAVVLMDQFSRNVYRNTPRAFALDSKAITWVQHLLASGRCDALPFPMRFFLLVPFMHQEDLALQEQGVALFAAEVERARATPGCEAHVAQLENGHKFMAAHRDVVARWGRFPHRNAALGRASTAEEEAGLTAGTIAKF